MSFLPIQQPQWAQPQPQPMMPVPQHTWHTRLRDGLLAVSNVMDLPGSSVRDTLAGRNPFDQYLDPLGYHADVNRVSGRALLQHHGLLGQGNSTWHHLAGIGAEVMTDPLTAMFVAGRIAPHMARLMPRTTAAMAPTNRAISPFARFMPAPARRLDSLVAHNIIARADPIMYMTDRDANGG